MRKRLVLSIAMLAVGAAMLAAASIASPGSVHKAQGSTAKKGGIFKATLFAGIENIDPQRSYYVPEWQYEWLTGRMLLNYRHATGGRGYQLINDAAKSYTVSRDGRTYTFHLRHGMKFSNGKPVTAANFKHTLLRILHPEVGSPIASFLTDPSAVNVVGALQYNTTGKGSVAGVRTKGPYTFIIKLTRGNPLLPTLLAMPDSQAEPLNLPYSKITSVGSSNPLPSAGRYYVQSYVPDRSIKIRKNKFYKALGAPATPGVVDGFDYDIGVQQDQALLLTKQGKIDWAADGLPSTAWGDIFKQYGTKGRARVFATSVSDYVTMNNAKGVFSSLKARQAVSYGINRKALVDIRGPRAGSPQCSLLTPAIPGYKRCTVYPVTKPNLSKAKSLAKGHTGHINYWYTSTTSGTLIQQLGTSELNSIGFSNIDHKAFQSGLFTALGKKGNDYDFAIVGWSADFPDPYDYINKLLSGKTIQDVQNNNTAYFNVGKANKLMDQAARLKGQARINAYGNLDNQIMKTWAPIAGVDNRNDREFFSARIAPKSIVVSPIYEIDLGKIALK